MHRIDHETKAEDLFGTGKDGFTGGDPELMIPPTRLTSDWANGVQEEVARAVEAMGALDKARHDQLARSIRAHAEIGALAALRPSATGIASPRSWATDDATTLVAVGSVASYVSRDFGRSWTTLPEETWTIGNLYGVDWGAGLFAAVGTGGEIYTSPDGIAWTARAAGAGYSGLVAWFQRVFYDPHEGIWIALGDARDAGAPHEVQTSPDAITWTRRTNMPERLSLGVEATPSSAASRDGLIAIAMRSDLLFSTDAGASWNTAFLAPAPAAGTSFHVVSTPGGIYAISTEVGVSGPYAWREPRAGEGEDWVRVELPIGLDFSGAKLRAPHVDPYTGLLTVASLETTIIVPATMEDPAIVRVTAFAGIVPYPYQEPVRVVVRNCTALRRVRRAFVGIAVNGDVETANPEANYIYVAGPLGF